MGRVRCPREHHRVRLRHDAVSSLLHTLLLRGYSFVCYRLTAAKEAGASIEIDGKKVALGIPGGRPSSVTGPQGGGAAANPGIPLGRGATADEAGAAMLLCVQNTHTFSDCILTSSTALRLLWRRSSQGTHSRSLEELGFDSTHMYLCLLRFYISHSYLPRQHVVNWLSLVSAFRGWWETRGHAHSCDTFDVFPRQTETQRCCSYE